MAKKRGTSLMDGPSANQNNCLEFIDPQIIALFFLLYLKKQETSIAWFSFLHEKI